MNGRIRNKKTPPLANAVILQIEFELEINHSNWKNIVSHFLINMP